MDKSTRAKLEAQGWQVGSAADFLGLSPEEAAFAELKLTLSAALRTRRTARGLTQGALAKRLGSSQSRVAKMEAADPTVSVDLLLKSLFALGVTSRELAATIAKPSPRRKRRVAG